MAAGVGFAGKTDQVYNGRVTSFFILSCIMAASGGILFGYDLGSAGGVSSMQPFLEKFFPDVFRKLTRDTTSSNYCKFDSQLLTAFTSSLYIASLFTSFAASPVTRSFGRKASMLVGGFGFLVGAVLSASAVNVSMLIIGRIFLGVGIGFTNQAVPLYLSELPLPQYRGAINNGFSLCISSGVLFASLVNYGTEKIHSNWGWRTSLAIAVVPAVTLIVGSSFLPETPNSLIQRGKSVDTVRKTLQKIRGTEDVHQELDDLIMANSAPVSAAQPPKSQLKLILQRKYRPQLVMAFMIPFFQQVTGINVLTFYSPIIFNTIGMKESASLMSAVILGVIGITATVTSMSLVDRIGRRKVLINGGIVMFFSFLVVWGTMATKLKDHGEMPKSFAYLILLATCIFSAAFSWSWGPLGWLVPSEIFPLEIRSTLQSTVVAVGFLFNFVFAQSLLAMLCRLKSWVFFFFGMWVFVMTVFVYLLLPETKNVPIEQMGRVWRGHWFWKRVVGDDDGADERAVDDVVKNGTNAAVEKI